MTTLEDASASGPAIAAPRARRRGRRLVVGAALVLLVVGVVAWRLVGGHAWIVPGSVGLGGDEHIQEDTGRLSGQPTGHRWLVGAESGWFGYGIRNDGPVPVVVSSAGENGGMTRVVFQTIDIVHGPVGRTDESLDSLRLAPGEEGVAIVTVEARCLILSSGSSVSTPSIPLRTSALGVETTYDLTLDTAIGVLGPHTAAADCD